MADTGTSLLQAAGTQRIAAGVIAVLGVGEGGSGVPLDAGDYRRSVEFWSKHANWR